MRRAGKQGIGSAYRAAFAWAIPRDYELVVVMDADGSHDPREVGRLLEAARTADVVVGSRYIPGGRIENWPLSRLALSWSANRLARLMVGRDVHDWTSGFKCYRRDMLKALPFDRITSEGYSFQVEILFHCVRDGWRLREVPITFVDRRVGQTKMSRREIYQAAWTLLRIARRRDRLVTHTSGYASARAISPEAATLWLIAVSGALRFAAGSWAGLCYGESYYFACAHHPSLGYFDHPPLSILLATASLHVAGDVGPPRSPLAVHRAVRGDDVAAVPPRPEALRRMARLLRRAPHEPRARLLAERGDLPPARRAAHVLLARVRLVSRASPAGASLQPADHVVGRGRSDAGPRAAQQVHRSVPGGGRRTLHARSPRPVALARATRPVPGARDRSSPVLARPRLERAAPLGLLRLAEHARAGRAAGDSPGLGAA